jgi:hypothetical protein
VAGKFHLRGLSLTLLTRFGCFFWTPTLLRWHFLQVNLFQKPSFLHQLTHNMTRDCSLNSKRNTSWQHVVYKYCFECQNKKKPISRHIVG